MFSDKTWKIIGAKSIFGREKSLAKKEKKIKKRLAATIDNTNRTTSEILILHPKISRTVKREICISNCCRVVATTTTRPTFD